MRKALIFFSCLIVIKCEFINSSYSLDLDAKVTLRDDDSKDDVMSQAFRECSVQNILLITSSESKSWPVDWVLRQAFLSNVRMAHYDFVVNKTEALDDLIWEFYHRGQVRNFILVTAHYGVVIDKVTQLFYDTQRGEGAVLSHKATFTLVVPSAHLAEILPDMTNVVLDNIALMAVGEESRKVQRVFTLMYRERRRREWESVDIFQEFPISSQSCRIFPNTRFGLNGRNLTILAKEWLSHLHKKTNKVTGKVEYVGFYVNIINTLSTSLNFTIHFTPDPAENDTITWAEFSNSVGFGQVDFGATTYISNSALYFNHSVSFTILWSNVSGVYLNNEKTPVTSPLKLFRLEVYGCLLASLLFTMCFHWILTNISLDNKTNYQNVVLAVQHSDITTGDKTKHSTQFTIYKHQNLDIKVSDDVDHPVCDHIQKHANLSSDLKSLHSNVGLYPNRQYSLARTLHRFKNNNTYLRYKSVGIQTEHRDANQAKCKHSRTLLQPKRLVTSCECDTHYQQAPKSQDNKHINKTHDVTHSDLHSRHQFSKVVSKKSTFLGKSEHNGRCIEQVIELFFKLAGSIFSQDSLPEPKKCSARILLWSWCLMLLVLTAVFTGNITANLVDQGDSIPFSTFEELLQRKDYKWGVFHDSSFYNVMKNTREGTILRKLYDKMEQFALTDPTVKGSLEEQVIKLGKEKYVTFVFADDLEYLREQNNLPGLVIMKDSIMMSNMGFIFPKTSTLNELVSEGLLRMTDTGVLDYLHRTKRNRSSGARSGRDSSETALDLFYMEGLFYCCGCGLALAGFFLILECIYVKLAALC